jgi:O-acetyl-ADP-ribose deacetylase (regulator of RNase III)
MTSKENIKLPHILFFDYDKSKINKYLDILGGINNTSFHHGELKNIMMKYNVKGLISPANSYGIMTGGIDKEIVKLYPEVQKNVINKINSLNYKDSIGKKYIPVGSCEIVVLDSHNNSLLLIAPTMFLPKNICYTDNVYNAFKAILNKLRNMDDKLIICCRCLGTGIGGMSPEESATQILKAIIEFT